MIELLIKQVPPPASSIHVAAEAWSAVERRLGLELPSDYKSIIATYGDFAWCDFLHIFNPFCESPESNYFQVIAETLDAERTMRSAFPYLYPLALFPEPGGLFPVFVTDNGDLGFWITTHSPENWPLLLKGPRAPEFEVRFSRLSQFLFQFTGGRLRSTIISAVGELPRPN